MNKLQAYWRAFRGYCPACNSDAPEIDHCEICKSYRGPHPPASYMAALWLAHYLDALEMNENWKGDR